MAGFLRTHPDYAAYSSSTHEVSQFPVDAIGGLNGLISRDCGDLKDTVNLLRSFIPEAPTTNWSGDWLESDLSDALRTLSDRPLHKMMDALSAIAGRLQHTNFSTDLEELLVECKFGYWMDTGSETWFLRDERVEVATASVDEAIAELPDAFEQALSHFEKSREHLGQGDDRSRKDALRDAMSAMESFYKQMSGENDIADSWKALRDDGTWGPTEIVKDGYSIWNHLHQRCPDVRHGQASASVLSEAEAYYWMDRIIAFVKFMSRMHKAKS